MQRQIRLGRASAKRRRAGGKQAVGRASLSLEGWRTLVAMIHVRAGNRCERCGSARGPLDPDHAIPRSKGSADNWGAISLLGRYCCHRLKDEPYGGKWGRLAVYPSGTGRFLYVLYGGSKESPEIKDARLGGRAATEDEAKVLAGLR